MLFLFGNAWFNTCKAARCLLLNLLKLTITLVFFRLSFLIYLGKIVRCHIDFTLTLHINKFQNRSFKIDS